MSGERNREHKHNKNLVIDPIKEINEWLPRLTELGLHHIVEQWNKQEKFCGYTIAQLKTIAEQYPLCVDEKDTFVRGGWQCYDLDQKHIAENKDPYAERTTADFYKLFMHMFHTYPNAGEYKRMLTLINPEKKPEYSYVECVIALHFNISLKSWDCEEEVRDAFKNLDLNNDGYIQYDEFLEFMVEVLKEKATKEECVEIAERLTNPYQEEKEPEFRKLDYNYYIEAILPNRVTRSYLNEHP
jgi:Ca2+-binding EF-hand superfamily protein